MVFISRPAEVLMTGRPKISSLPTSSGVVGENVHINCAAISIPEHKRIAWRYHGSELDDSKRILITFSSSFGPSLLFPYISPLPPPCFECLCWIHQSKRSYCTLVLVDSRCMTKLNSGRWDQNSPQISQQILITFSSSFGPSLLFSYRSPSPHYALNILVKKVILTWFFFIYSDKC